jgi:hypothetical protein
MDNPNTSKILYEYGIRSYIVEGVKIHKNKDGYAYVPVNMEIWHALRAYQDEQRKKGVPIMSVPGWRDRDYDFKETNYTFAIHTNDPCMRCVVYNCEEPGPRTPFTHDLKVVGRFTNFRWRDGYPKETQKQTI